MKDFRLNSNGDVVIENNKISMVADKELLVQKVRQVLQTNLGEWFGNEDEGIDLYAILAKNPNEDLMEDIILSGLLQVDETFKITSFECYANEKRNMIIRFSAINEDGEEIELEM